MFKIQGEYALTRLWTIAISYYVLLA